MGNTTLIRSDGSKVVVPDDQADHLRTLGYRDETGGEALGEGIGQGLEDRYSTPLQKLMTLQEGADSGGSLGISDLVFGNEGSANRARYNPGTRIAGEIAGTLVASEAAPGITPVGKLVGLAEDAGEAIGGGSKIINTLVRGSVEGAGFGAGQAITTAKLDGDPITAEAILAGMGQGALWGGGLSAFGGAIESKIASRAAAKAAEEAAIGEGERLASGEFNSIKSRYEAHIADTLADREKNAAVGAIEDGHYQGFSGAVHDAAETLKTTARDVEKEVGNMDMTGLKMSTKSISNQLVDKYQVLDVRKEARAFEKEFALAQQAAKDGNYEKLQGHLSRFKDNMVVIEQKLGGKAFFDSSKVIGQANKLIGEAESRVNMATRAAETMADTNAVHEALSSLPRKAEEFVGMRASKIEKISAAIDKLQKLPVGEFAGVQTAVKEAVEKLAAGMGVTVEGTPGAQVQGLWKALKGNTTARGKEAIRKATEGNLLWEKMDSKADRLEKVKAQAAEELKRAKSMSPGQRAMAKTAAYGAGAWSGKALGIGYPGYMLGSGLLMGLVGLKGAILGTLSHSAMKWTPKAMRVLQKYGPRMEPLAQRLDGTMDESTKNRRLLVESRMKEINEAAPAIRDTLYRAVQPLGIEHPELAAALHTLGVQRFQFLMSKMPKDPGMAWSKLKSTWKPDAVEVEKFSRYYEAFHDPAGVLTRAVLSGKLSNEAADAVKESNPELWNHFRSALLMRVADPAIMAKLNYQDQVHLSTLTGIAFHASMDPRFIAASQQMHVERNKPLEMNPRIQPGGGAGRPSGPGPNATSAQRITEH